MRKTITNPLIQFNHRHTQSDINRWMLFVDGENFTFRAQEIAAEKDIELIESDYYQKDIFIWPELTFQTEIITPIKKAPLRSYYYTSVAGDDNKINQIRSMLWGIGFHPEVFKKHKGRKSKGVDITLTKDVLSHAFQNHFDMAVLVGGDADYIPLVEEVKRLGKFVYVVFISDAKLDSKLIWASDMYHELPIESFQIMNTLKKIYRNREKL